MKKKQIAIIGGGPSALIAAEVLSNNFDVSIYEKEKSVGQKFLVAGKGGFNLTNSLTGKNLSYKYLPKDFLNDAIHSFDSTNLRAWLNKHKIETFVGTSGRVFSKKEHNPIDVLANIKSRLLEKNVRIFTKHKFTGFDTQNRPLIEFGKMEIFLDVNYYIFALGGASWAKTGSDGKWRKHFEKLGIKTNYFQASNCGINISWHPNILAHHIGKPLKNIIISINGKQASGEVVLTKYGLEGNAIYELIPQVRTSLNYNKSTIISIDFKPNNTIEQLHKKFKSGSSTTKDYKRLFNLNNLQLSLLKSYSTKESFLSQTSFINKIKSFEIKIDSLRPIDEAISTVGGIDLSELNSDFSLVKYPNIFTIGEMVDWDAPTGGFLLQGCFSMGYHTAKSILSKFN